MGFDLQAILRSKDKHRREVASLSPAEKVKRLEQIQKRSAILRGTRSAPSPPPSPTKLPNTFGGRAAASGINYEEQIAAFIAVKMLCGDRCTVWSGISGADLGAVTMQAPEYVDDIVVHLKSPSSAAVYISAKKRSHAIALSPKNPTFTESVTAFTRQHIQLEANGDTDSRIVWAIPSSAGRAASQDLATALSSHRSDAKGDSLQDFLNRRAPRERDSLQKLLAELSRRWKRETGDLPSEQDIRAFLDRLYIETFDFAENSPLSREIEGEILTHVVSDRREASKVWSTLLGHFKEANEKGLRSTEASLRTVLISEGLSVKSRPDYSRDIRLLEELTRRNVEALHTHSVLPFALGEIHIPRRTERSALLRSARAGHLLLTGEPGCGKSGLFHSLAEDLEKEGIPVVLLLAEELTGRDWKGSASLPDINHSIDEVLAHWPNGAAGVFITDALDAIRNPERLEQARRLLLDVRNSDSPWTVIASVREFDLKCGKGLRDAFPGSGVEGHSSPEFAEVAHFHLGGLDQTELDALGDAESRLKPFLDKASVSPRSEGIRESPFYLRIAAELISCGVAPERLADWVSPALLLRNYWASRVADATEAEALEATAQTICRAMVDQRRLALSIRESSFGETERRAVRTLRSSGVLASPHLQNGGPIREDVLAFTHHLLHDYAIARSLIPSTSKALCDFAKRNEWLAIFYRNSFLFALDELWDGDEHRNEFWDTTFCLESSLELREVTRIAAPLTACRRVEVLADLTPLLDALQADPAINPSPHQSLSHLASGLEDVDDGVLASTQLAWSEFAMHLMELLDAGDETVERPLVLLLARLDKLATDESADALIGRNVAARGVLARYTSHPVGEGWPYAGMIATETICSTYTVAPEESGQALRSLLAPNRLKEFPHEDLFRFACKVELLPPNAHPLVLELFEAAFSDEPAPGEWEEKGSLLLGMRMQTRDQWHSIQHCLADYYEILDGSDPEFTTAAACIAWNSGAKCQKSSELNPLGSVRFRGQNCDLVEDFGHIWGRGYEHEQNRILSRFELLLLGWIERRDEGSIDRALDVFAARNRTSLLWSILFEAGAEHPNFLGAQFVHLLEESVFLTHLDYIYASVKLFGALHRNGDADTRRNLEILIHRLPARERQVQEAAYVKVQHAQDRMLGALREEDIVLEETRALRDERQKGRPLPENRLRERPTAYTVSDNEMLERRGIDPNAPANARLLDLQRKLEKIGEAKEGRDDSGVQAHWDLVAQTEAALDSKGDAHPEIAADLWGHLIKVCRKVAADEKWPPDDDRWATVRRLLVEGSNDRKPLASDDSPEEEDGWPSWGIPAPRLDAALGLMHFVARMGKADSDIEKILRRFVKDPSHPLRFNFADHLGILWEPTPEFSWELADSFIDNESRFSVLDVLLLTMNRLLGVAPKEAMSRIRAVRVRAMRENPVYKEIFTHLAQVHLFHYLRTGDIECREFVELLIEECDSERASAALSKQLGACRSGGWLTAGDAISDESETDQIRSRTWRFFEDLLATVQSRFFKYQKNPPPESGADGKERFGRCTRLIDHLATQLFFASGAYAEKNENDESRLTPRQIRRFWTESEAIFRKLVGKFHPHTTYELVQTLRHLLPCDPEEIFLLAAAAVLGSAEFGLQNDSIAKGEVVKLIQRALADHPGIFREVDGEPSECLDALLDVLDCFVKAGWSEARQLTHRLEEIYR